MLAKVKREDAVPLLMKALNVRRSQTGAFVVESLRSGRGALAGMMGKKRAQLPLIWLNSRPAASSEAAEGDPNP